MSVDPRRRICMRSRIDLRCEPADSSLPPTRQKVSGGVAYDNGLVHCNLARFVVCNRIRPPESTQMTCVPAPCRGVEWPGNCRSAQHFPGNGRNSHVLRCRVLRGPLGKDCSGLSHFRMRSTVRRILVFRLTSARGRQRSTNRTGRPVGARPAGCRRAPRS
jgi:hypothetical protein